MLPLNEYEGEGESDPGKKRMTQKGNEPGNDPEKCKYIGSLLRLVVSFLEWLFK